MKKPRPRSLSRIKQERLASKEQLRAVFHCMELLELPVEFAKHTYPTADPEKGVYRHAHEGRAFLHCAKTGEATWANFRHDPALIRVVLNPDEGSTLYTGFQFLALRSFPVSFRRDELPCGGIRDSQTYHVCIGVILRHKLHAHFLRTCQCTRGMKRGSG